MKISTRIMVSLVVSLIIIGGALIGLAYTSMHQEQDSIMLEFKKASYESKRKELKNEMRIVHGVIKAQYKSSKKKQVNQMKILKNHLKG